MPLTPPSIREVSQVFAALGDESRLRILQVLLEAPGPLSQGGVAEAAGLSQANASKHLRLLLQVGLVGREACGNQARFSVTAPWVPQVCECMCTHVAERVKAAFSSLN